MKTPSWVPFPSVWAYLAGTILVVAGIALALNKKSRIGRSLDWRINDRSYSVPMSGYVAPRPRRARDQ